MNTDFFAAWAAGDLRGSRRFRRWRRFFWPIRSDLHRLLRSALTLVPQISQIHTDFFAAWAAWNLKGSRRFGFPFGRRFSIHRWTQISLTYSVLMTQIFPLYLIRKWDLFGQIYADYLRTYAVPLVGVYIWVGVKGVYKNFCIYIVRKR